MNMSKLITLVATIALIGLPLTFTSSDADAATTGKRVKRSGSKKKAKSTKSSKRTHRLVKKKTKKKKKRAATSRSRARQNTTVTTRTRRGHAQKSSRRVVRRKTVVRHNTGHHVGRTNYRTSVRHHHTSSCSHYSHRRVIVEHHRPRTRTIVHHHTPRRTVVYHETQETTQTSNNASIRSSGGASAEFYINGGLGVSSLRISEVSDLPLSATNYRFAIGGKGELFGMELGVDGGKFQFDDGTSLNMLGINVDVKLQPSFGMIEPYVFVGFGAYNLYDEVLEEDAGSGAFRAGLGADLRINNVGIGAKYTWSGYSFENDQSYEGISATSNIVSANLSFYF